MKKTKTDAARLTLLLGASLPEAMVATCKEQAAIIQQCPDYPNEPEVQTRTTSTLGAADDLGKTLVDLGVARGVVFTLEGLRDQQTVALRTNHTALVGALNVASQGKKAKIVAWGGKVATRTALPVSTDAPVDAMVKTTTTMGSVQARCRRERGVLAYLFQYGSEPSNPDAWPKPATVGGSRYTFAGLPIGQKVYVRIAIIRRRGGQGEWSGIMEVTVR